MLELPYKMLHTSGYLDTVSCKAEPFQMHKVLQSFNGQNVVVRQVQCCQPMQSSNTIHP